MTKFINPFTDVGFKRIFGQEINKDLLIDFLNSLLVGERHIHDIQFLDKEILGESVADRNCIYDIYCTDENGEQFIVLLHGRKRRTVHRGDAKPAAGLLPRTSRLLSGTSHFPARGTGPRMAIQPESRVWHLLHELPVGRHQTQTTYRHLSGRPRHARIVLGQNALCLPATAPV